MTDTGAKTEKANWQVIVTKISCTAFEPITWSAKDTAATVAQVKQHNAVFEALCK
jgi:hypothetical protein